MSIFRIPDEEAESLAREKESAMGFQVLELSLESWSDAYLFVVLNSQFLVPADDYQVLYENLRELRDKTPVYLAESPDVRDENVRGIVVHRNGISIIASYGPRLAASLFESVPTTRRQMDIPMNSQPLVAAPVASGPRAYFRFSQFPNDRRVLPDGSFRGGTYATTANDLRMVPSGFAAVARYALPNPMAARYVYGLVTDTSPDLVGATVPNYGQAGGGVEVLFWKKVSPLRAQPWTIPDE